MKKYKLQPTLFSYEYYLKTACENLEIELAWKILSHMEETNLVSHTALLAIAKASALCGDLVSAEKALSIFEILEVPGTKTMTTKSKNTSTHLFQQTNEKEMKLEHQRIENYLLRARAGRKMDMKKRKLTPNQNIDRVIFISKNSNISKLHFPSIFQNNRPTKLEICSGLGDWVIQRSQEDQNCNWIALEIRYERIYHIWSKMIFEEIKNLLILNGEAHTILTNSIPPHSLSEVYINFPDPPVWEESKQKLIDQILLNLLFPCILPKGKLIIVTDDETYANSIVKELETHKSWRSCFDTPYLRKLPEDYGSSYFDRFWKQGKKKKRYYLKYERKETV